MVWRIEDAHGGDTPPDHPCCTATAFTDGHCAWVLHSSPSCSLQNRDPSGFGESRYISIMEYAECSLVFQCMPRELYSQRLLSRWDLVEKKNQIYDRKRQSYIRYWNIVYWPKSKVPWKSPNGLKPAGDILGVLEVLGAY